jgi:apolipoprotein N-acyltransferase
MEKKHAYIGIVVVLLAVNIFIWAFGTYNWWSLLIVNTAMLFGVLLGKNKREKEIAKIEAGIQ